MPLCIDASIAFSLLSNFRRVDGPTAKSEEDSHLFWELVLKHATDSL